MVAVISDGHEWQFHGGSLRRGGRERGEHEHGPTKTGGEGDGLAVFCGTM